jgi:hypothetical protein
MKITSQTEGYEKVETQIVTTVSIDEGDTIVMSSYLYNGTLAESETAPAFWNQNLFDKLSEEKQEEIVKLVNESI